MAYNKVVFNGETLIDLTKDDVTAEDVAEGVYFHLMSGERVEGTSTKDSDTKDATALQTHILSGKTAYVNAEKLTGTMTDYTSDPQQTTITNLNADNGGAISYRIAQGYHNGDGYVTVDADELAKLSEPKNIKQGVTILGFEGELTGQEDVNAGKVEVESFISSDESATQEYTAGVGDYSEYTHFSSVIVKPITYKIESDAASGGDIITIG